MVYFHKENDAKPCVESFHEATRLYTDTRFGWGRRVAFFNNNEKARAQLVDKTKQLTGAIVFRARSNPGPCVLSDVLALRKSTRRFSMCAITLEQIGALLQLSIMAKTLEQPDGLLSRRRAYPSAGAIYAVEHYVIGLNVATYEQPFVAYCSPQRGELIMVNQSPNRGALEQALGLGATENAAFAIVQTIDLERCTRKYQERGYRFGAIEAGMAAQTLCLVSASLGLSSLVWGGHNDHLLDSALCIAGTDETSLSTLLFGG